MVIASIYGATKNYNAGFTYLLAMTLLPALLLASVNFEKGKAEVRAIVDPVVLSETPVVTTMGPKEAEAVPTPGGPLPGMTNPHLQAPMLLQASQSFVAPGHPIGQ